jgi:hypothetical protein
MKFRAACGQAEGNTGEMHLADVGHEAEKSYPKRWVFQVLT